MKIISKRKDYYDYLGQIYGVDDKVIYFRKPTEQGNEDVGYQQSFVSRKSNKLKVTVTFKYKSIWLCDAQYPFIEVSYQEKEAIIEYPYYKFIQHSEIFYTYKELVKKWKSLVNWSIFDEEQFEKHFNSKNVKKINLNTFTQSPQLLQQGNHLTLDIILKDYDFNKVMPPEQAFQRVSMFVGAKPDPPQQIPTEMNRFEAKGFDKKTSFRNM